MHHRTIQIIIIIIIIIVIIIINSSWVVTRWQWSFYIHPSIHPWRYNPFRALASLTRRRHSSLFVALLLHPLVPSSCSTSLWTTSAHLVLGLPTGLVVWNFPFRTFFGILSSSILIIWPAHSSLLILMSSTIFGWSFYIVWWKTTEFKSGYMRSM